MAAHLIRSLAFSLLLILAARSHAAEVREPKVGSPERKAIMETMRGPVSKHIGKRVTFTGTVKICGDWATFNGDAAPSDGVAPKGGAAGELELDFFALLRLEKGRWKLLHWGFAGDIGVMDEARQKFPKAPKELVPDFDAR
jgi:hypothetical protein